MHFASTVRTLACALVLSAASAFALVPDNGFGTATMPPDEDHASETPLAIVDGLPPGTTIDIDGVFDLTGTITPESAGGSLGGTAATGQYDLHMSMQGTGSLAGYNRFATISNMQVETHYASRIPGHPVQSFDTTIFALQGQITGDPDFDLLRITAGNGFGLPSPGHTTLTRVGSSWAVDSFFDITYRIDFVGAPGGPLAGRSGSTTGTIRMSVPEPASLALFALAGPMLLRRRRS